MPLKTGGSHAVASFVTLVAGTLLSKYLWSVAPPLGEASVAVVGVVQAATGTAVPGEERFAGAVVVMVGLSFVWGVVYHVGRHS
jgi:hypothetical protein